MRAPTLAIALVVLFATRLSVADESAPSACSPTSRARPSVALLAGYGFQLDTFGASGFSAYRFGFGARAGVTLASHLYLGGVFIAHVGTSISATGDGGATYAAYAHDTYAGPEVGYDIDLGRVLLRGFVGTGLLAEIGKTSVRQWSVSDDHAFFFVSGGALAAYRVGDMLFGLDLRMPLTPAQSSSAWAPTAMISVGMDLGGSGK